MQRWSRRDLLRGSLGASMATWLGQSPLAWGYVPSPQDVPHGTRPPQDAAVKVLHARDRVPLSFIIDDSTCLVNMGAYCMPQFNSAWPQNPHYWKPWQDWPREIPDSFVREFGEFCVEQGVRGKYSIVPNPACVGWLDRELPGWSKKQLKESLKLVRELMVPSWDITPEMITHTRVLDLKTGKPIEPAGPATMENSWPSEKKSVDEMAAYLAYALQVLKNCDLPCEAITTPGGFGNKCKSELSLGARQAIADVFSPEIPHYFKYIAEGNESTLPRLEHVEGVCTDRVKLIANVPAGTGDWFGGWDGDIPPQPGKYVNDDATGGRMVELIERGEPAVMFCHWAGLYSHGKKTGLDACKKVITTLNQKYRDRTLWMKTSEMARYQAARELTSVQKRENEVILTAPFACPAFTLEMPATRDTPPQVARDGHTGQLTLVQAARDLKPGKCLKRNDRWVVCFDLAKGITSVQG